MKYMIHSCDKRLWYVNEYLIPSMKEQGIKDEDIIIWNDDKHHGNLGSYIDSYNWIIETQDMNDGIWHLCDDVIISRDFKERSEKAGVDICCGFISNISNPNEFIYTGVQPMKRVCFSSPCIYIPNRYVYGFIRWFNEEVVKKKRYYDKYLSNMFDDWFFVQYLKTRCKKHFVNNLKPSIVDHIDYLIGGTIVQGADYPKVMAYDFRDKDLIEKLSKKLEEKYSSGN